MLRNGLTHSNGLSASIAKLAILLISTLSSLSSQPLGRLLLSVEDDAPEEEPGSTKFWWKLGVSVLLILGGGVFAGLTIGLMGQDIINLQVLAESGEGKERKHAAKVLKLLQRGKHWVLVTLLLSNVLTNETLPIVMDSILPGGIYAIAISTVSIVIFGEIIPQALCVRYGLAIGAAFVPPMLVMMYLMYPIAYPIAKLLDYLLGDDEGTVYKKAGLKTLVTLHKTLGADRLNEDEVTIITAVLDLKDKSVASIMTPIEDVFTMSADTILDEPMVDTILKEGYSRIPIFQPGNPTNFVGMLLVKILITYDPEDRVPVSNFTLATLPETRPEVSCLDILNFFQEGKSHMVLISESPGDNKGALGLLTCEDIIEELIGEEILDETDVYIDVHQKTKRSNPPPLRKGHRINYQQLDRRVSSLAATGAKALFRPANVASNPKETKNTKVTIKPTTNTQIDSVTPAQGTTDNERTGLRPPGHPDRSRSPGYGATSERAAMQDNLSSSPATLGQFESADRPTDATLPQNREVEDETDDVTTPLIDRETSNESQSSNEATRRTSRVRSGSIVETTYLQPDGTSKVVVEMDHHDHQHENAIEEEEDEREEMKNGVKVPTNTSGQRQEAELDTSASQSPEETPLLDGKKELSKSQRKKANARRKKKKTSN
ncbi:Uncharacterized protein C4B3.03c [Taphrina deformans PYCC 5710]|uniref:Uncharacterized protein C4B3.03c n=1 Tax=Taphrina deformans (strain PYCC 5710 / ATCC 11124 / CBS 356.35 / IMI 108563 / JCM 9778 / NBRC 8474) TaxID=1097556 RepID=R4XBL6_TAPDE|nr:Uncharacterized protein C4B3.03c [Taphrina deformans PYCC 5710]|eukprot:CCG81766.1 Uncharacterized protein C4B3.03c [Taphrina deformans PYCC 5710]